MIPRRPVPGEDVDLDEDQVCAKNEQILLKIGMKLACESAATSFPFYDYLLSPSSLAGSLQDG